MSSSPPPPGRKRRLSSDPGSCWASLPEDLLGVVTSRLLAGDLLDYVRFRAVCTSWRSGTSDPRGRGIADPRFHPRRWMMLPERHYLYPGHPNLGGLVRFLNLDTGALVCARIPFLGVGNFWAIDSVDGLLLLLRDTVDQEGAVRLLHPFTGDIAEFPPIGTLASRFLSTCPAMKRNRRLTKSVCASVSVDGAGAITVMIAISVLELVAFATSTDRQWTVSTWEYQTSCPPLSFQGKLYVIDTSSALCGEEKIHHQVLQIDPPVRQDDGGRVLPPPKLIATVPKRNLVYLYGLVECGSEILVLGHNDWSGSQVTVLKLADLVLQRFIPIQSIGGNTLFVEERIIRVSSRILPTAKGDNVVYICPKPLGLCQYNLSSGSLVPAVDACSLYGSAPGPSSLILYIFTCCIRNRWSRGLLFREDGLVYAP